MALIVLNLEKSGTSDNYEASLLVFDEFGNRSKIVGSITPIPSDLEHSIDQWRSSFSKLVGIRRGTTIKVGKPEHGNCSTSAKNVRESFDSWLTSQTSWQRLQNYAQQYISSNEEVQINIETLDEKLQLLPWNEIFSKNYRQVETSISLAQEFWPRGSLQARSRIRILAVLGNPMEVHPAVEPNNIKNASGASNSQLNGVDINFDQQELEKTKARGAYIESMKQPSAAKLKAALQDPDGWHIFFFAGHSKSYQDNTIGSVVLNKEEEPLDIDELKQELAIAINHGLQIAIFNSCDGLGLAHQLAELGLPQSIVMREPVPDDVAKDFLQQFLKAFSNNRSLFESVRRARQYIKDNWETSGKYPGASWLPTITLNPAVSLPMWNDFVAESPLARKHLYPLAITALLVFSSLSISLYFEFNRTDIFSHPTYIYYAQLYPHIVLYPWLFLWVAYYMLYKAWCQIRNRPKLWRQITGCIVFAAIVLRIELLSPYMMFFELKDNAVTTVSIEQELIDHYSRLPKSILDTSSLVNVNNGTITFKKTDLETAFSNYLKIQEAEGTPLSKEQAESYQNFMYQGLNFSTWKSSGAFSLSRKLYGLIFVAIVACVLISGVFWREIDTKYVFNKVIFVRYIIATQLVLLCWFPFRFYHNLKTKAAVFGLPMVANELDMIAYSAVLLLLTTSIYKSWKFEASFIAGVLSVGVVVVFVSVGIFQPQLVGFAFGTQSNPATWVLWPIMGLMSLYMIYSDVLSAKTNR